MIIGFDRSRKPGTQQIAQQRHQCLKGAKIQPGQQHVPHPQVLHGQSLADGHGKRVHRKPNPNQKKLHNSHMFFSLTNNIPAQANKKHMQQPKPHVHAEQILYAAQQHV